MINIGQAARSRSAKIRSELAKRGLVETRVEHTEKVDLAEGDRERISALEKGLAELSNRLETLTQESSANAGTNATVAVVSHDDGDLLARVESLEDFATAFTEMRDRFLDFARMVMSLDSQGQANNQKLAELQARVEHVAHEAHEAAAEAGALIDAGLRAVRGR